MTRTHAFALVLTLALGLFAPGAFCDDEPEDPAPAKPGEADEPKPGGGGEEGESGDEAGKGEPVLKIVQAGADPKALRFRPTPGSRVTTTAKLVVGFNMGGMGGSMDIGIVADMAIGKGTKDGQYGLSGSLTKCLMAEDPENPMAAQLKPMIDALQGVSFEGEYSERGKWIRHPMSNLQGVPPQSAEFGRMVGIVFNGILVEVPEEPLGAGGKWTDEREVTVRGTKMKSCTTYEVEKVDGGRVTLRFTDKRSGGNSKMNMMGMEVTVVKASGEGSGTMTLDLALGVAAAGTLKMKNVQETDTMGNIESTIEGEQATKAAAAVTSGAAGETEK